MGSRDINVIALVKGGERYVFLYDDDSREETLRTLARYAANPDLKFSWYDASVLGQKVRQAAGGRCSLPAGSHPVHAIGPIRLNRRRDRSLPVGRDGARRARPVGTPGGHSRSANPRRATGSRAENGSPCSVPMAEPHQREATSTRSSTVGRGAAGSNWLS